ncbi:hypothetical protein K1Y78_14985 [Streptomyces sp. tea 10]|nr:hypothetical protein [Streptomyces sp. tea 10]
MPGRVRGPSTRPRAFTDAQSGRTRATHWTGALNFQDLLGRLVYNPDADILDENLRHLASGPGKHLDETQRLV